MVFSSRKRTSPRATPTGAFSAPTPLTSVNSSAPDQLPRLSADGLLLMLGSTRAGSLGGSDLWLSTRSDVRSAFPTPVNWTELNTASQEDAASLSRDGLVVYFVSDRAGGLGGRDIWTATRASPQARFGAAQNLSVVNSASSDAECVLTVDGRELFFSSARDGARKIWRSIRSCQ